MGNVNAYLFNAKLNPIIAPMLPQNGGGSSSDGASYSQLARSASKEEDDLTINGVNLKELEGMEGQRKVRKRGVYNNANELIQLKNNYKELLSNAASEGERDNILNQYRTKLGLIKQESIDAVLENDAYADDRAQWKKAMDNTLSNKDAKAPALFMDFGNATSAKQGAVFSDGTTMRTHKLFEKAVDPIIYPDRNGAMTKYEYLKNINESELTDQKGKPIRFKPYVETATDADYLENIKKVVNVKGSDSGNQITMITDGQTLSISGTKYDEMVNSGNGYVNQTWSSNEKQFAAAINSAFDRLDAPTKNAALSRLVSSGTYSSDIRYGNDKLIKAMPFDELSVTLHDVRMKYENESDSKKREDLYAQGVALSAALINGVNKQVKQDASLEAIPNIQNQRGMSIVRSDKDRQALAAVTAAELMFTPEYLSKSSPDPSKKFTGHEMYIEQGGSGNYQKQTLTASRGVELPSGKPIDVYMSFAFPKTGAGEPRTFMNMYNKNMIMGGMVMKMGMGIEQAEYVGPGSDNKVIMSYPIINGKMDTSKPAQTAYASTMWKMDKDAYEKIMVGKSDRKLKTSQYTKDGWDYTRRVEYTGYNESEMVSLSRSVKSGFNPFTTEIVSSDKDNVYFKALVEVDPGVFNYAKSSIMADQQVIQAAEINEENLRIEAEREENGTPINVKVEDIDVQMRDAAALRLKNQEQYKKSFPQGDPSRYMPQQPTNTNPYSGRTR